MAEKVKDVKSEVLGSNPSSDTYHLIHRTRFPFFFSSQKEIMKYLQFSHIMSEEIKLIKSL